MRFERFPQRRNVDAQADRFGASLRPNALNQRSLADDLVGLLRQDDEEIHGARTERHDLCAIRQKPVSDRQLERAEAQRFAVLIAHGTFSTMPILEVTSPEFSRS